MLTFAKSATKHGISHARAAYIIEHCGLVLPQPPPKDDPDDHDERLVFLGDDRNGLALEVIGIELADRDMLVIHAQRLREKNRVAYNRVRGYQQ